LRIRESGEEVDGEKDGRDFYVLSETIAVAK
jgi:hypothetical protein